VGTAQPACPVDVRSITSTIDKGNKEIYMCVSTMCDVNK
jgi:hypothetical protein